MKSTIQRIARASAALAFTGMLGFGAAQAFATPASQPAGAARVCNASTCEEPCLRGGYAGGVCRNGTCTCIPFE